MLTVTGANRAIRNVDTLRGTFGAIQTRFESSIASLATSAENLSAARSRIEDTDFTSDDRRAHSCSNPATGGHRDARPGQFFTAKGVVTAAVTQANPNALDKKRPDSVAVLIQRVRLG